MDITDIYFILKSLAIGFAMLMLLKYFVFLVMAPFYPVKEKIRQHKFSGKKYNPLVSVIVPAWDEEAGIVKTLKSVMANAYEKIEVVVVNDGSKDNTAGKILSYKKSLPPGKRIKIKFINNKHNKGKGSALNDGVQYARGSIILTIDGDSALASDAIENLVKYYKDPRISGVVGSVQIANDSGFLALVQKLEYTFGFYFKRAHAVMGAEYIFGGACASFRKAVFSEIGLYDTTNKTEDIEFTMRMRAAGLHATYGEDVVCFTEGATDFMGLVNQRVRWKKGRFDTFIKYRTLLFSKDKQHNKALTHFILPYALLGDLHLLIEPVAIALLVTYSLITLDFLSIALGVAFMFIIYFVNAFFGRKPNLKLLILYPFTWPVFYFLVFIEFNALLRSTKMIFAGVETIWQNWNRKGLATA